MNLLSCTTTLQNDAQDTGAAIVMALGNNYVARTITSEEQHT